MKRKIALLLTAATLLAGCGNATYSDNIKRLSAEDAVSEMGVLMKGIDVRKVTSPSLDVYTDEQSEKDVLADIDTFDITVQGNNPLNIEISTVSEFTGEAPDDWINVVAKRFNNEGFDVNGKKVSVTIREMSAGETVTYISADAYQPNVYIPSNYAWGEMLEANGVGITKLADRIAGNTAGILMNKTTYDSFHEKYKDDTLSNVLKAANAGDILFAYTNPYTSSTGLNVLTAMLHDFDSSDPLSSKASEALLEYQKNSPPVAYTTSVLRNQAKKGIIDAMVMEEQAYINTPELRDYKFIPFGIRHDHPVYTFNWNTEEENQVAQMFVDYCLREDNQKLATEKGFNKNNQYKSQDTGLSGTGYLTAQSIWKDNKTGGVPVVAVFVCDTSGSMEGTAIQSIRESLSMASQYISQEHYVGLVSYASDVTINLPIDQFTNKQRAYFNGEVKNLVANGGTATYNAVLVALDMINKKLEEVPNAKPMLFVLTDGATTNGYRLDRVTPIVGGLYVPIYSIAYNYTDGGDLQKLSSINEAAFINADTGDIINQLRNLFNVQM